MREVIIGLLSAIVGGVLVAFFALRGIANQPTQILPEPEAFGASVPQGAVMAFDLPECPSGWLAYGPAEGRVIMGAGPDYPIGDVGGAREVMLTPDQMPSHAHALVGASDSGRLAYWGSVAGDETHGLVKSGAGSGPATLLRAPETEAVGAGAPIDITPAYVALAICQKG